MPKSNESTDDLMKQLSGNESIERFIDSKKETFKARDVSEYLTMLLQQSNISKARLIEKAGVDRVYGYEIIRGKKVPGRDTLLRFLISLGIGINDIQHIFKDTGFPILYAKNIRDAILIYGIQRSFDVDGMNRLLFDLGQKTI